VLRTGEGELHNTFVVKDSDLSPEGTQTRIQEINEILASLPDTKKGIWISSLVDEVLADIVTSGLLPPCPTLENIRADFSVTRDRLRQIYNYDLRLGTLNGDTYQRAAEIERLKRKEQSLIVLNHLLSKMTMNRDDSFTDVSSDSILGIDDPNDLSAEGNGLDDLERLSAISLKKGKARKSKADDHSRGRKPIDRLTPFSWVGSHNSVIKLRLSLLDKGYIARNDKASQSRNFLRVFHCDGMRISDDASVLFPISWVQRVQELGFLLKCLNDKGYLGESNDHFSKGQYAFIKPDARRFSRYSLQKNSCKVSLDQERMITSLVNSLE
jgi:hypothetical protein